MSQNKPCPFCGSTKIDFVTQGLEGDEYHIQALCDGCGTTTGGYATKDDAIAFWNKRAPVYLVTLDSGMMDGIELLGVFSSPKNAREKVLERWNQLPEWDKKTSIEAFPFGLDQDEGLYNANPEKSIFAFKYTNQIRDRLGD
jgi:Lar family restriction alleviation protein